MFSVHCPRCAARIREIPDNLRGKCLDCPRCRTRFVSTAELEELENSHRQHRHRQRSHRHRSHPNHHYRHFLDRKRKSSKLPLRIVVLLLSGTFGALVTAGFGQLVYMSWGTWQKATEWYSPKSESLAMDSATLIGAVLFLLSTFYGAILLHRE
jgi:Zn-finger nucleic acid-binding protein